MQKEHVLCTPDGKVLFVDGPFFADGHNDDWIIWDSIVHDADHDIHRIFPAANRNGQSQQYTVMADRGYSDCLDNDLFKLKIPHGIQMENAETASGNKKKVKIKLTTVERNVTKLVYFSP